MPPETLRVAQSGPITTVTLLEPTMRPRVFLELDEVFSQLAEDPHLRAVILDAAPRHFTYGLDLPAAAAELGQGLSTAAGAAARLALHGTIRRLQRGISAVEACPVPVIAAIHGWCIGGGIDLITACDLRLASADARFSVRETKIAIVADLGTLQRLPRIVGQGHARELAFTGKDIDAARAAAIGLVSAVYPDRDQLYAAALALAEEIAQNPPLTVRGVKRVMDYSADRSVDDGLAYVAAWNAAQLASEDLAEAMTAFFAKRPPDFKGR
jgi:enoyl-CoA hydratase